MSERDRGPDLELLADLDAGALDPDRAARVRAAADDDPHAAAVLAALAATRAELAALPEPPVPPGAAARWDAALAAEAALAPGPGRPATRRRWWRPLVVAAAVLGAVLVAGVLWARPAAPGSLRLSPGQVDLVAVGTAALGATDAGALADPARRADCLRRVAPPGLSPGAPLLGGRQVEFGGEPATLLVLATGELGRFHVLIVDRSCGPEEGRLLDSVLVGGR
jgi:hypothetical protein